MQIAGEGFQQVSYHARAHPLLEATVAGLIRRKTIRKILPSSSGAKDPQDPIKDGAVVLSRSTSAAWFDASLRQQRLDDRPLFV